MAVKLESSIRLHDVQGVAKTGPLVTVKQKAATVFLPVTSPNLTHFHNPFIVRLGSKMVKSYAVNVTVSTFFVPSCLQADDSKVEAVLW